jgi:hypothetical protein
MKALVLMALFGGCQVESVSVWERAVLAAPMASSRSQLSVDIQSTPLKIGFVSEGALVTDGHSLRMALRDPMGLTTLTVLMTDGHWALSLPAHRTNLVASDGEQTLRQLTDGALGLADFHQLLMGRLSWLPAPLLRSLTQHTDKTVQIEIRRGVVLRLALNDNAELSRVSLHNTENETLLVFGYGEYVLGRPTQLQLDWPRLAFSIRIALSGWESFTVDQNTFEWSPNSPFETVAMERVWPVLLQRLLLQSSP